MYYYNLEVHPSKEYEWGSLKRNSGESTTVQSYTKPLGPPIEVPKGSKVYKQDIKFYV